MRKRILTGLLILVLLAAVSGGGYWVYTRYAAQTRMPQTPVVQTATVRRGDIVLTADGTGNLFPSAQTSLAFRVNGTVAEVNVKVGDRVKKGDVLARLETLEFDNAIRDATYELEQARLALKKAQRKAESGSDLAAAWRNVESARLGLISAQGSYSATLLNDITVELQKAKFWNDYWQGELQGAYLSLQENPNSEKRRIHYEEMGARAAEANANYLRIQQEANNNLVAAQRSLLSAQQAYQSALESYNDLKDSDPVKEAELVVLRAETKLTQAQMNLANATLIAPMDGTITEVTLEVGKSAGTSSITLADLDTPLVRFWVEESDLGSVLVGNRVNIVFEALPDLVFTGKIVRVDPALVSVGNTQAVQAWASVDRPSQPTLFFSNMSAEVEVIAQETRNALLVPVQALRELAPGQNAVFVVQADGKLELRLVQVGLKDYVNAEVLSGVNPGEVVSLGTQARTTQTTQTQTQSRGTQVPGMPPGDFVPFPGGGIR